MEVKVYNQPYRLWSYWTESPWGCGIVCKHVCRVVDSRGELSWSCFGMDLRLTTSDKEPWFDITANQMPHLFHGSLWLIRVGLGLINATIFKRNNDGTARFSLPSTQTAARLGPAAGQNGPKEPCCHLVLEDWLYRRKSSVQMKI